MPVIDGFDISHWQTITDADAIPRLRLMSCKATEGSTSSDATLESHIAIFNSKAPRYQGVYHWIRSDSKTNKQFDNFTRAIDRIDWIGDGGSTISSSGATRTRTIPSGTQTTISKTSRRARCTRSRSTSQTFGSGRAMAPWPASRTVSTSTRSKFWRRSTASPTSRARRLRRTVDLADPYASLQRTFEFHRQRFQAIIHRNGITPDQIAAGYFLRNKSVALTQEEKDFYSGLGIDVSD